MYYTDHTSLVIIKNHNYYYLLNILFLIYIFTSSILCCNRVYNMLGQLVHLLKAKNSR